MWYPSSVMCFEAVAIVCPATQTDCIMCFVWEEHMPCPCPGLSNFPAAGIFAVMQSACMCLSGTAAVLSQPPSASLDSLSLPAPLKRMGEDRRGAELWGLSRGRGFIAHQPQRGTCLFPSLFLSLQIWRNSRHS